MKPVPDRIAYFTRKANQYGRARYDFLRGQSATRPPALRYKRLYDYKAAVARQILAERGVING
ncbi:hypothetical protein [Fontibacillus sp. BL9]|uniref:hypothetical protein n=1 Tax=Fontibacillus sp. BL9 TaxID=3389971 RepID=UPI0039783F1B